MNTNSILLAGLLLTLALTALSAFIRRPSGSGQPSAWTQFFLVALRLSIGWHFLVEGLDKLNSPSWSSEPYLREASGPLAPYFRELAGDRLLEKLTLTKDGGFPSELAIEWQAYLDGVVSFYELDAEQTKKAQDVLDKAKANTLIWMTKTPKVVQMISEYPPPLMVEKTIPERLVIYQALDKKVRDIEAIDIPEYESAAFAKYKTAKANLNKWRAELKGDLDRQTNEFKQALREKVLVASALNALPVDFQVKALEAKLREQEAKLPGTVEEFVKNHGKDAKDKYTAAKTSFKKMREDLKNAKESLDPALRDKILNAEALGDLPPEYQFAPLDAKEPQVTMQALYHQLLLKKASSEEVTFSPQVGKIFEIAIDKQKEKQDPYALLPAPGPLSLPARPIQSWQMLDWSDFLVKWGITLIGACLLLGLLTRTSCLLGALLLLSFFLAMPPLPNWPESPRVEGHYMFINKNIIEMLALLALATTHSGRWAGLDGLFYFCCPGRWKKSTP